MTDVALLAQWEDYIRRQARSMARDDIALRDDLAQEGRMALLKAHQGYDPARGVALDKFLRVRVRQKMLNARRKLTRGLAGDVDPDQVAQVGATPEDLVDAAERAQQAAASEASRAAAEAELVEGKLARLNPQQRAVMVGHLAGQSARQLAAELGISRARVRAVLSRAELRMHEPVALGSQACVELRRAS